MKKPLQLFLNAFGGLSRQAWLLSLMVFINRSGAIVLPFLGVYVSEVLHFSLTDTGLILSLYGLGSVSASFLGGWLTDKFGHFKVQFLSQVMGGFLYFLFITLHQFEHIAIGVFILGLVNDCIRPSNATAVALYATPETLTRAFSLNRMSVNLGFVLGPAVGGLLAAISFNWLFIANGVTGIAAGIFFFIFFYQDRNKIVLTSQKKQPKHASAISPYRDIAFIVFVLLCSCFAVIFYQLFSTLPLFYKQVYQLSEESIGLLMSLNGLTVLLVEMVLVYLLSKYVKKQTVIVAGILLLGFSFVLFNLVQHVSILVIAMILFSLSEILAMPFMSTIAAERSGKHNRGAYMGLFTVMYALPLIIAPSLGTNIISRFGYDFLWWACGGLATITAVAMYYASRYLAHSKPPVSVSSPDNIQTVADRRLAN